MEFILAANMHRRHLTDDQRAQIAAELLPVIKIEAEERQKATRMKKGETRNPAGRNQHQAEGEAATELSPPSKAKKRGSAEKEKNSTRGKVAAIAGVSSDKAGKAIAIEKSGDKELIKKVKAGEVKLAKAKKEVKPKPKSKKKEATEPYDLEKDVTTKWSRWIAPWPKADIPEIRKIVVRLIKEEEKKLSKVSLNTTGEGGEQPTNQRAD